MLCKPSGGPSCNLRHIPAIRNVPEPTIKPGRRANVGKSSMASPTVLRPTMVPPQAFEFPRRPPGQDVVQVAEGWVKRRLVEMPEVVYPTPDNRIEHPSKVLTPPILRAPGTLGQGARGPQQPWPRKDAARRAPRRSAEDPQHRWRRNASVLAACSDRPRRLAWPLSFWLWSKPIRLSGSCRPMTTATMPLLFPL